MANSRLPVGRVFVAGVGTRKKSIFDNWDPRDKNSEGLWFRKPQRQLATGDHIFALAPGRNPPSVVVALFEVNRPEPSLVPKSDFDDYGPDVWPWNIGVEPLLWVPPREARRIPGLNTPRTGVNRVREEYIDALYEAVGA